MVQVGSAEVYNINGTVNRSDTNVGLGGATVTNGTNTTTTSLTAPIGWFNLPNMQNNTGSIGWTITYRAEGFTQQINYTNVSGADNFTNNVSLTPITPVNSALTASSITKNSATISWTVTATDNVNNNYVGNRITYYASGVPSVTSAWSNTTSSPSFALSNLRENLVYTYTVETYNRASSSYTDSDSSTFTTTYIGGKKKTPVPTAIKPKATAVKKTITTMVTPSNNNQVFFLVIVIILGGAYFVAVKNKGKKDKGKKKK